ncbi:MAG: WD40 repeat domain-containing protein, partial [Planctomycetaceae bacterium]|nr:WD40 repeat domain-containing protein [Planctomycetaceae bacterium]
PQTASEKPSAAAQDELPLFSTGDLPISQPQQKPLQTALVVSDEITTIDTEQQAQLQAKLAETEKKVEILLQEQGQIQTQSKRLVSETLLRESAITLEKNPIRSLFLALKSIQMLQELGLPVSDLGKTILAQAYAAQSVGESLIERAPNIEAQSVSSNGRWLLTSHSDRTLWLWDISKSDNENRKDAGFRIDVSPVPLVDILLTPNEQWVVGARADGLIAMWNMTVDRPSETTIVLRDHIPGLCRVQISPDGRWLVAYGHLSSNEDRTINSVDWNGVWMWDMSTFKQGNVPRAIVLRGHEGPICCLAISSDSRWLATGSEDRSVRIFDLKSAYPGGNQKVLLGHQLEITDLQFAPNGQWIATGSRDNTVRIWDLQSETTMPTAIILKGHSGWISSLVVSPDGNWFATAGYDQSVRLWNTQSFFVGDAEKESTLIVPGQGTIQRVTFTPDSGGLITYGVNRSLKVWNLATESFSDHVVEIPRNVSAFSFGENGRWLVLSSNQGTQTSVSLWPLNFEEMIRQATRFKETALPTELHQREDAYAKQFEQRMIR